MLSPATTKSEIIANSKDISLGDYLLINGRKSSLYVETKHEHYKSGSIQNLFILRGNGCKYLLFVYKDSAPLLYTEANFKIEDVDYTDGVKPVTEMGSSERVRKLFVNSDDYCSCCNCEKLYNSKEDSYYCPICLD